MNDKKSTKGRKPIEDKKVPFRLYINQSVIDKLGGYTNVQSSTLDYLTKKAKKIK